MSRFWRCSFGGRLTRLLLVAARRSRTRGLARRLQSHAAESDAASIIRSCGYIVVAAATTHGILLRVLPAAAVGSVPLATTAAVASIGACMAVAPRPLAAAWRYSATRRVCHGLLRGEAPIRATSDAPHAILSADRSTT
jgi:hypothetical protein